MKQAILTTKRDQITREDKEGLIRRILLVFSVTPFKIDQNKK